MKKLLKVLLPPFIGFLAYFLAIRYSSFYFSLRIDEIGEGTVQGFMAYYRYALPLLFVVAVLTQAIIVVPIWQKVIHKTARAKVLSFFILFFICLVFAAGISYLIWDHQTGPGHLIKTCLFLLAVQLGYWVINILVLLLFKVKPAETDQEAESNPPS
ncbi:MAG TPA: hypothetical protein VHB54_18980 [Mucilaginibacter sp.]|nr:hypothetical protein [Mucilaginibacter sp.]HVW15923.1 hypothetical protein [Mucilaginibacter sp.]